MRQDDGKRRRRRIHKSLRLDFSFPFKGPAVIPPTARGSDSSRREKKQAGRHIRCDEFLNPCLHITFLVPSLALLLILLLIVVVFVDSYFYFCSLKNCCAVVFSSLSSPRLILSGLLLLLLREWTLKEEEEEQLKKKVCHTKHLSQITTAAEGKKRKINTHTLTHTEGKRRRRCAHIRQKRGEELSPSEYLMERARFPMEMDFCVVVVHETMDWC